jgi:hypothetical protein
MKQKIMETLLESNNTLTKEEIMWAASNLPDTEKNGGFKVQDKMVFNHNAETLFDSIGITETETRRIAEVMTNATKKLLLKEDHLISQIIEYVIEETADIKSFNALIVYKLLKDGINEVMSKDPQIKDIIELIKKLGGSESKD